jgi:hypothetical protein
MALATRDELLRKARVRTRQEIEEHEGKEPVWTSNEPTTQDETADYAAELFGYVDPTAPKPVARIYC